MLRVCLFFFGLTIALTNGEIKQLNEETLALHNKYRALHGSHPLVFNHELVELATKEAEIYAATGKSTQVHYKGAILGMNIGIFKGYKTVTAQEITDLWYDTGKHFNYKINDFQNAGSFTQLIWKKSKEFGLGLHRVGNNIYVVALYNPPGNIIGHVIENVAPSVKRIFRMARE